MDEGTPQANPLSPIIRLIYIVNTLRNAQVRIEGIDCTQSEAVPATHELLGLDPFRWTSSHTFPERRQMTDHGLHERRL